jgi:hypothetical protein
MYVFFTSALVGGQRSVSHPGSFISEEETLGIHSTGGWVGPRTSLQDVEKRIFLTLPGSNSDPSVVQPIASRYTDCATPASETMLNLR